MSKRILRIRPGQLANFSGGAGYMPFIFVESVLVSFVGMLVSKIVLKIVASVYYGPDLIRALELQSYLGKRRWAAQGADFNEFVRYAIRHLGVCAVLSLGVGYWCYDQAIRMVYAADKSPYVLNAAILSIGPFLAAMGSLVLLVWLMCRYGPRWRYLFLSTAIYIGGLVACIAVTLATAQS